MKDPEVVVLADREERGLDRLGDRRVRAFNARTLSSAIRRRYSTYAHLLLYTVPGETKWPRINKPALSDFEDEGREILLYLTALDYDNVGHAPLDKQGYLDLLDKIDALPPDVPRPTWTWKTRSGARLLFQHPPVSPLKAEALHLALRDVYEAHGIPLDPRVWEWNRPHALPWVVRDGVPLDPEPVLKRPPLSEVPECADRAPALRLNVDLLRAHCPDSLEASSLVWKDGKLTEWGRWAKSRMQGRDPEVCFDREAAPDLPPGARNPTLFKWAGSLVSMLAGKKGTTPEHVFGVMVPTIDANMRPGLPGEIWRGVSYCWSRENAQRDRDQEDQKGFLLTLRESMDWANLPDNEEEFLVWVRSHMILVHGSDYYVLQGNGRYWNTPVKHPALVAAVRHSGLVGPDRVLPELSKPNVKTGTAEPVSPQTLVDRLARPVEEVVVTGGAKLGGILRENNLVLTTFARRSDVGPRHSEWVDTWFSYLFGEHKPTAEEWISCALAFEEGPVAALSIHAPGGVGKNLLMSALARTITTKTYTVMKDVIGPFQPKLHKTPFVHVDEAWPRTGGIAAQFRDLVGTWTQSVNRKNIHQYDVLTCPRVLMTANKDILVSVLFGSRDMNEAERQATAERVIHLRLLNSRGAEFFAKHGGIEAAKEKLNSDEIAGHFLHLYESVGRSRLNGRFLMVGDKDDPFLRSLAFASTAVVGEVLVRMFERGAITPDTKIKASAVLEFMDSLLLTDRTRGYNLISLGRALQEWVRPNRKVDLEALYSFAATTGMPAPALKRAWNKTFNPTQETTSEPTA